MEVENRAGIVLMSVQRVPQSDSLRNHAHNGYVIEVNSIENAIRSLIDARILACAVENITHQMVDVGESLIRPRRIGSHLGDKVKSLAVAHKIVPPCGALIDGGGSAGVRIEIAQNQVLLAVGSRRTVAKVYENLLHLSDPTFLVSGGHP